MAVRVSHCGAAAPACPLTARPIPTSSAAMKPSQASFRTSTDTAASTRAAASSQTVAP